MENKPNQILDALDFRRRAEEIALEQNIPLVQEEPENFSPEKYYDILAGSLHIIMNNSGKLLEPLADLLIYPPVNTVHGLDFRPSNYKSMVEAGESAAREKINLIKQMIG